MIKKIQIWTIFIMIGLLFTACGDDNAYDGKTGLISGTSKASKEAFASIQKNVLIPNARKFLSSTQALETSINAVEGNITSANLLAMQSDFRTVIESWKSVQTTLVAPDFDASFKHHVFYIDQFHTGNEDMAKLIDNILQQQGDMSGLLYKTTTKGIPALEYLLFANGVEESAMLTLMNSRRLEAATIAVKNIQEKALEIVTFYESDTKFASDAKAASHALLNVFIDSIYKLKEWRVGDPAGFTVKYKNKPDATRLEYYRSHNSLEGLKAILNTHAQVIQSQSYENLSGFSSENGAASEVKEVQNLLNKSLSIANSFDAPLASNITEPKVLELYKSLQELYTAYYESLVNALSIKAKIVEADGD